jgi:hypothetical protein
MSKQMWFVPDSGMDPELCEVDNSRGIIARMHKDKTGQESLWVVKHQRLGIVGWSLFFSEQDALDMQIDNCQSFIRDRQRKLDRLREKRLALRGCTPLCDPDAPTPHHQCKCCDGTTAESCTCHVEVGESTPVSA